MIFIFGYNPIVKTVGPVEEIQCPNCNNSKHWVLEKVSYFISLFFIPIIPVKADYYIKCPICNAASNLDKQAYQNKEPLAKLNREAIDSNMFEEEYEQRLKNIKHV